MGCACPTTYYITQFLSDWSWTLRNPPLFKVKKKKRYDVFVELFYVFDVYLYVYGGLMWCTLYYGNKSLYKKWFY